MQAKHGAAAPGYPLFSSFLAATASSCSPSSPPPQATIHPLHRSSSTISSFFLRPNEPLLFSLFLSSGCFSFAPPSLSPLSAAEVASSRCSNARDATIHHVHVVARSPFSSFFLLFPCPPSPAPPISLPLRPVPSRPGPSLPSSSRPRTGTRVVFAARSSLGRYGRGNARTSPLENFFCFRFLASCRLTLLIQRLGDRGRAKIILSGGTVPLDCGSTIVGGTSYGSSNSVYDTRLKE